MMFVVSYGDAEICEQHALMRLTALGYLALPFSPGAAHARNVSGDPGLALVFNESGIAMWDCCRPCAQEGFEVAAITANADSPVARSANVSITIKDRKSPLTAYEPNHFADGAIAFMSRAIARAQTHGAARDYSSRAAPGDARQPPTGCPFIPQRP